MGHLESAIALLRSQPLVRSLPEQSKRRRRLLARVALLLMNRHWISRGR